MTQQPQQPMSDAELVQLANDLTITADDLALLAPSEAQRFARLRKSTPAQERDSSLMGGLGSAVNAGENFSRGAFKGAGESAFHLGSAVRQIPGVGHVTDALAKLVGPEGTNPEQAFAQVPQELNPQNSAENAGKIVEQIAEFFLPAGKAGVGGRLAADLVGGLKKTAGPVRKMATDAAWKVLPVADDALAAAAVSAAHGDDNPQYAAAGQAVGSSAGLGAAQLAKLLSTKAGQQLGPLLAAIAAMTTIEGVGGGLSGTLGGGLGAFSAARSLAKRALSSPGAVGRLGWAAEQGGEKLGTAAAGVTDQTRKTRRRSEP